LLREKAVEGRTKEKEKRTEKQKEKGSVPVFKDDEFLVGVGLSAETSVEVVD
jgi:hypothetical protein